MRFILNLINGPIYIICSFIFKTFQYLLLTASSQFYYWTKSWCQYDVKLCVLHNKEFISISLYFEALLNIIFLFFYISLSRSCMLQTKIYSKFNLFYPDQQWCKKWTFKKLCKNEWHQNGLHDQVKCYFKAI